jgi:hypothetical protein
MSAPDVRLYMPPASPRTSKRARQAAKAEVRNLLDELWDADLLTEQFRKSHNEMQRAHARNGVADPEQWRGALEHGTATVVTLKAKLKDAVKVLERTYKDPRAFKELMWDDRFCTPPKLFRAQDAMMKYRLKQFSRKMAELHAERSSL